MDRVFAATDAYHVVNPNLVDAQIEGGVIFGMTAMLYGEITIKNGAAVESNFNEYRMVALSDAPDVKAYLANTGGLDQRGKPKWGGVGRMFRRPDRGRHCQCDLCRQRQTHPLAAFQECEMD